MKQKKNKLLIAIIIVLLLVIILCLAYIYLATDFLKSNKQLFFKYATQIAEQEDGFIENELKQYLEKQKTTPYTNSGKFNATINVPDEISEQIKNTNNMDITFSGQTDKNSSKMAQDISINYSSNINFPFSFKKIQDIIGIQTNKVGSKYITVDMNQSEDINKDDIGNATQNIEKIKEFSNIEVSETITHIKDTYVEVLNQNLQDDKFSKVQENEKNGYKLTLNGDELKNILVKILETLKNDQVTINKLNEYAKIQGGSSQITANDIDDLIEKVNKENLENNIEIIVYQEHGKTSKILVKTQEINIIVEKMKTESQLQYNVSMEKINENEPSKIYFNVKYDGLQSMQNINEDYELGIDFSIDSKSYSYKYNFSNNIDFKETSNIEEFTSDNSLNLNSLEEEQRNNFMNSLSQRLSEVNKKQMEELGLNENENPIMNMLPTLYLYSLSGNRISNEAIDEMNQADITSFNAKFELYQGTNLGGGTVKGLLTTISTNNGLDNDEDDGSENETEVENNEERKIKEINFNGEEYEVNKQTIAALKEEILTEDYFKVEFERDTDTGRIYRVVINKK